MADLIRMLGFTSRALEAQRFGLDVTGQNIANVNTPGYARRVVDLGSVAPVERLSAGGGVEVLGVRSLRDELIARRLRQEIPSAERDRAAAGLLGLVEVAIGAPGQSVDKSLDDLFDAFAALADAPTSSTARQEVVRQAQALVSSLRDTRGGFEAAARDADLRVRDTVAQVNDLTTRIASLNRALSSVDPSSGRALQLRDEVTTAVERLSSFVAVNALRRTDGGYDVEAGGATLVVGEHAYALTVADRAGSGVADIVSGDQVVTGQFTSGRLGGLLRGRDELVPAYVARLDELAFAVAGEVNRVHAGGFDLAGQPGGPFFEPLGTTEGAARALQVSDVLSGPGDESRVAASATGAVGDNGNARALAALRDARAMYDASATFTDAWSRLVYAVGRDSAAAQEGRDVHDEIVVQVRGFQDAVSGVSLDEEAAEMMRFQRAYEANARFFRAIDDTLDVLMRTFDA